MMKNLFILILIYVTNTFGQVQIGADIDGEAPGDWSGSSTSLSSDGNILAIGATRNSGVGHVRVYQNLQGVWTQIGADINGEAGGDEFGASVSLSSDGTILAIGAPGNDGGGQESGRVRVYQNLQGVWTQIGAEINGDAPGAGSGSSVSLSSNGTILAIGTRGSILNSGRVRVFRNIAGIWSQIGNSIPTGGLYYSINTVSLSSDGNIMAIGIPENTPYGYTRGKVQVYINNNDIWTQVGGNILGALTGQFRGGAFGYSVSLSSDGTVVAIGASIPTDMTTSGQVEVYKNIGGTWTQLGSDINGEASDDYFGLSVSLSSDGTILAIGAPGNDGGGLSSGHVRVYRYFNMGWVRIGNDIEGEAPEDQCGRSVSLSSDGTILAIGTNNNDGNGLNSGHVRVYNIESLLSVNNILETRVEVTLIKKYLIVKSENDIKSIQIFDISGKLITSYLPNTTSFETSFNEIRGVYIAQVTLANGNKENIKLLQF
jgi:Flp pilus assembly pilin Flp